ncbi:energy transducer TonB, partial [Stenotrophomonas maltophilia]|nr:energy transducer TonB [Stenotrophomonas maltophilia]
MMLLIPAVAPKAVAEKERNVMVTIVDAPPAPATSIEASVDISSKAMNPPRYPPAAFRAGIQGEVILI